MYFSGSLLSATAVLLLPLFGRCVPVLESQIETPLTPHIQVQLPPQPLAQPDTPTSNSAVVDASLDQIVEAGLEEDSSSSSFRIPSRYESTVLGRRLLGLSKTGVLTTTFPSNITSDRIPSDVANTPIGLPEYIASCEEPSGNPTILAMTVSTSTQNALAGSNVSLTLSWWDEYVHLTHRQPWSAANLPRLNMVGYLEEIPEDEVKNRDSPACFTRVHRDSVMWLPGKKWAAHKGVWMRLIVREVYWIGGFGDRNYIGWFDTDEWANVKVDEWLKVRLPGEK
ncbi:hypothetical protein HRR83_002937 [Exophiala dermatitidis]|uniref:CREG-like beta-barrel domain-containing protein n=2 Tax=Exophiala dermatitidis TaxID=5970 RepID=H6BXW3_EXODN|nr:uncharacterized protein HMPREF1120_05487 [Exophiala dermatitidis NIH/UT8656]KAJ4506842.1 hypothetical protein HRR73_008057 [Exophiala dermatitidis]EHY57453.1 hypothetical protein HMPREF1120_05487 [Exophiala dermatitidis NIH/UT8656]KAJ4516668.1 hypothetical protein HRR75_003325 [Exophiala dermatitidis]KAJ4520635.1 hypothetical protein HRR74_003633 [Exophiala dermatitidis]KAJ4537725.1 hypothetical protein HRR76_005714 [Exophiala dermatitidis]